MPGSLPLARDLGDASGPIGDFPSSLFMSPEYAEAMATELKAWFFLIISLLLLLIICGVAALGLFTRPTRWSERPSPTIE